MLIQLAGHLYGRALQEWGLLSTREESLQELTKAMRSQLDPCSRALAAQDFHHAPQRDNEPVSDFIRCLEQLFKLAYGRDGMSEETPSTLFHSQLHEGLHYEIMKAPAVSESHSYKELCLASIYKASQPRGWASGSRAYGRHEMQGVIFKSTRHECSVVILRPLLLRIRSRHQFSLPEKNGSHCGIRTHVHPFTRRNA